MADLETAKIHKLAIAPIKSGGLFELTEAILTPAGLETVNGIKDHSLFIVRATPNAQGFHEFITQRDKRDPNDRTERTQSFSELAKIKPLIDGSSFELSWEHKSKVKVPPPKLDDPDILVKLWEYEGLALEVPSLSEWVSDQLKYGVKVARTEGQINKWNRMAKQNYIPNDNRLRAQDGYPIHWFDISDIEDLSQRAGVEVPWQRFRPQIITEGLPAGVVHQVFEGVIEGEIAPARFINAKPCDRCDIPRVDQETGQLSPIKPLSYLKDYKMWWKEQESKFKHIFGENMLPPASGITLLKIGTPLVVLSHRDPSLEYGPSPRLTS